ncbi:hypothetical protein Drorol1_Dr00020092, partial [Drosera rotundifolia]
GGAGGVPAGGIAVGRGGAGGFGAGGGGAGGAIAGGGEETRSPNHGEVASVRTHSSDSSHPKLQDSVPQRLSNLEPATSKVDLPIQSSSHTLNTRSEYSPFSFIATIGDEEYDLHAMSNLPGYTLPSTSCPRNYESRSNTRYAF